MMKKNQFDYRFEISFSMTTMQTAKNIIVIYIVASNKTATLIILPAYAWHKLYPSAQMHTYDV